MGPWDTSTWSHGLERDGKLPLKRSIGIDTRFSGARVVSEIEAAERSERRQFSLQIAWERDLVKVDVDGGDGGVSVGCSRVERGQKGVQEVLLLFTHRPSSSGLLAHSVSG